MTPEQFCYWLQGRAELDPNPPTPEQWKSIRDHLQTVFVKVTPPFLQTELSRQFETKPYWAEPAQCFTSFTSGSTTAGNGAAYC